VTEAYHMNKVHWITLYLDSDVPTEEIEDLTLRSFELTKSKDKKKTKKRKEAL
jgi:predicted DNA-binding protein (MmcQ/YjbR family)